MKIIKFKAKRTLHEAGYRHIKVIGENNEDLGEYHDVIHLRLGGVFGPWINIDCEKDGTFRIFCFPSPEGPDLISEGEWSKIGSSIFIDVVGKRLPKREI